jgi:hypothetical protein
LVELGRVEEVQSAALLVQQGKLDKTRSARSQALVDRADCEAAIGEISAMAAEAAANPGGGAALQGHPHGAGGGDASWDGWTYDWSSGDYLKEHGLGRQLSNLSHIRKTLINHL